MRRHLFSFAAVVSLVLCLATAVLWVQCARDWRLVRWARRDGPYLSLGCGQGYVLIEEMKPWPCDVKIASDSHERFMMSSGPSTVWSHLFICAISDSRIVIVGVDGQVPDFPDLPSGFSTFPIPPNSTRRPIKYKSVIFPMWMPVGLASLLPIAWFSILAFAEHRRRKQTGRGLCSTCGYSLTGNTSGVCPECGTPIAEKAGAKA